MAWRGLSQVQLHGVDQNMHGGPSSPRIRCSPATSRNQYNIQFRGTVGYDKIADIVELFMPAITRVGWEVVHKYIYYVTSIQAKDRIRIKWLPSRMTSGRTDREK